MILCPLRTQRPLPSPPEPFSLLPGKQTQPTGLIYPDIGSLSKLDRNPSAEPRCSGVSSRGVENLLTEKRKRMRNTLHPHLHPTTHCAGAHRTFQGWTVYTLGSQPGYHTLVSGTLKPIYRTRHI